MPPLFLLLAGITATIQIGAVAILREPTENEVKEIMVLKIAFNKEVNFFRPFPSAEYLQSWNEDSAAKNKSVAPSVSFREAISTGIFWVKWITVLL